MARRSHDGELDPPRAGDLSVGVYDDDVEPTRRRTSSAHRPWALAVVAIGVGLSVVSGVGALLAARPTPTNEPPIVWPETGAFAVQTGDATALSPGAETALPIASLTKLVTVLVVLDELPLAPGETGPTFTMDAADVAAYEQQRSVGGQALAVRTGDLLTQRDLLELVLVASSNNHAVSLVRHVFGDEERFLAAARDWLASHDLGSARIADATGMSPGNQVSAADLLRLAGLAEDSPVVRALATQDRTSTVPSADDSAPRSVAATNDMLGAMGIDGLKTGHTDDAGYTAIITAPLDSSEPDGSRVTIVVLGAPSEAQRSLDVARLLAAARGSR